MLEFLSTMKETPMKAMFRSEGEGFAVSSEGEGFAVSSEGEGFAVKA